MMQWFERTSGTIFSGIALGRTTNFFLPFHNSLTIFTAYRGILVIICLSKLCQVIFYLISVEENAHRKNSAAQNTTVTAGRVHAWHKQTGNWKCSFKRPGITSYSKNPLVRSSVCNVFITPSDTRHRLIWQGIFSNCEYRVSQ